MNQPPNTKHHVPPTKFGLYVSLEEQKLQICGFRFPAVASAGVQMPKQNTNRRRAGLLKQFRPQRPDKCKIPRESRVYLKCARRCDAENMPSLLEPEPNRD